MADRSPARRRARGTVVGLLFGGLALTGAVAGAAQQAAGGAPPAVTFQGTTVVDVRTGRVLPERTVVVAGNRIQTARRSRSPSTRRRTRSGPWTR